MLHTPQNSKPFPYFFLLLQTIQTFPFPIVFSFHIPYRATQHQLRWASLVGGSAQAAVLSTNPPTRLQHLFHLSVRFSACFCSDTFLDVFFFANRYMLFSPIIIHIQVCADVEKYSRIYNIRSRLRSIVLFHHQTFHINSSPSSP